MTVNELIKWLEVRRDLSDQGDCEVRIHMGMTEKTIMISHVGFDNVRSDGYIDLSAEYHKSNQITLICPMPAILEKKSESQ